MIVSAAIAGLCAWSYITGADATNERLFVPIIPGIFAAATFIAAAVSYAIAPYHKLAMSCWLNYALCCVTTAVLVVATGGVHSPFMSLLVMLAPIAGVLGRQMVALFGVLAVAFAAQQIIMESTPVAQSLPIIAILAIGFCAGLPFWLRQSAAAHDTAKDRSYQELATKLDKAASTSEVVINAIGDGVLALDNNGAVRLINPAAQQMIGWGEQDAAGLNYKTVLKLQTSTGTDISDSTDPVMIALSSNKPVKDDTLSIQTQSDKSFLAYISVSPISTDDTHDGVIVVFRDITAERHDERQRAEFISTASHEMRTPVASIEGYLGLALNPQTASVDDRARNYIAKAHESAQHLGRLFSDLLDISRADDHRLKNDPHIVDVISFVGDIVEGLKPRADEKGLTFIYRPTHNGENEDGAKQVSPIFYANVDNDHLREIVQNLIENAIKYTPAGSVAVDVTGDEKRITISVSDTGIGIPREDQAHLFQKFYRVDNSDTREINGTGLGLYLCRRLTETIGGRLWVESEYKKGSTFFVSIPRADNVTAQRLIKESAFKASIAATKAQQQNQPLVQNTAQAAPAVQSSSDPEPQPIDTPPATPDAQTPYANTPLSSIEANPEQYIKQLRQQVSLSVPPRDPPK